jgi:uncharacterized protein (DUF58 family)
VHALSRVVNRASGMSTRGRRRRQNQPKVETTSLRRAAAGPLLPIILLFALLLAGIGLLNGALLSLALPFVVYLAVGLSTRPPRLRLHATRMLTSNRVNQDEPVAVTVEITNSGERLHAVAIRDLFPQALRPVDGATSLLTDIAAGGTVSLAYTIRGQRGMYTFDGVEVVAVDSFGLFPRRVILPAPASLFVLPDVLRLRRIDIRPQRTRVYSGYIPVRQGGPGIEFYGLREYQPGDPQRWINAKASARHDQTLFVNEFEQERVADVGLILDGRKRSDVVTANGTLFEHAVGATAAFADAFLKSGNRVGLAIYSDAVEWIFPGYGSHQRERILRALARAHTGDRPVFEGLELLPARLFPGKSQLVLISSLIEDDRVLLRRLRAQGYQILVISPDPIAFERAGLPDVQSVELATRIARIERRMLLRDLRRAGIETIDWQVDTPLIEVARRLLNSPRPPFASMWHAE